MKVFLILVALVAVCIFAAPFVYCSPMLDSNGAEVNVKIQR